MLKLLNFLVLQWFFLRLHLKDDELRLRLGIVPFSGYFNRPLRLINCFFFNTRCGRFLEQLLTALGILSFLTLLSLGLGESVVKIIELYLPEPSFMRELIKVSTRMVLGFCLGALTARLLFGIKIKKDYT